MFKNWLIDQPRGKRTDDFVLLVMDAQDDYLARVKAHRAKNPHPRLPKRPPKDWVAEVLNQPKEIQEFVSEWLEPNSQFGKGENEDTGSNN